MTTRLLLSNIVSYSLQVSVLVVAAATIARILRLEEPRAMLAYWRTLLLVCLVLPLAQPWSAVQPALATATVDVVESGLPSAEFINPAVPPATRWAFVDVVFVEMATGIALRLVWLTIGACGLRRLRRDATPFVPLPESVRHAQERIATPARLYVSPKVSGPITFGLFHPVVVFPPGVSRMPPHVQESITYHELLHVRRRDWLAEVFEEAVRSVLWFHPAIWWLVGRIRLTREQVVDQEVIRLTNSRDRYIDALLTFAVAGSRAALTPASAFLRRHVLKKRVARILQEHTMTTRRLIASLTASAAALALAAIFAVRSFPLEAQGFKPPGDGGPVVIVSGGEHLAHGDLPEYPDRGRTQNIEGDVVVEMTLNDRGEVSDARVLSGPDELRKATLEAVLRWHFSPAAIRSTVTQATLRFRVPAEPRPDEVYEVVDVAGHKAAVPAAHFRRGLLEIEIALDDPSVSEDERGQLKAKQDEVKVMLAKLVADKEPPADVKLKMEQDALVTFHDTQSKGLVTFVATEDKTFEGEPRLVDVKTERVSEAAVTELLTHAGVAIGDTITRETARRIRDAAVAMDEHFLVSFHQAHKGGLILTIETR